MEMLTAENLFLGHVEAFGCFLREGVCMGGEVCLCNWIVQCIVALIGF